MLDHHHALATGEESLAESMEKLEIEDVNIVYMGVAV